MAVIKVKETKSDEPKKKKGGFFWRRKKPVDETVYDLFGIRPSSEADPQELALRCTLSAE